MTDSCACGDMALPDDQRRDGMHTADRCTYPTSTIPSMFTPDTCSCGDPTDSGIEHRALGDGPCLRHLVDLDGQSLLTEEVSSTTEAAGHVSGYEVLPGFATLPDGARRPSLRFRFSYIDAVTGQPRDLPIVTLILEDRDMRRVAPIIDRMAQQACRAARRGFLPETIR